MAQAAVRSRPSEQGARALPIQSRPMPPAPMVKVPGGAPVMLLPKCATPSPAKPMDDKPGSAIVRHDPSRASGEARYGHDRRRGPETARPTARRTRLWRTGFRRPWRTQQCRKSWTCLGWTARRRATGTVIATPRRLTQRGNPRGNWMESRAALSARESTAPRQGIRRKQARAPAADGWNCSGRRIPRRESSRQ